MHNSLFTIALLLTAATTAAAQSPATGQILGHDYVDLGLSVMWATCNIGAETPSDYGDYFAWGETETKSSYTKENSATYGKDSYTFLDAASAHWGSAWRMPTDAEMLELINNCTWTPVTVGGNFIGEKGISKLNGNSIFLPAAGSRDDTHIDHTNKWGYYWSSSPFESTSCGYYVYVHEEHGGSADRIFRFNGCSIRPVADIKSEQEKKKLTVTVSGKISGHDYVDLGLSVKWATCNIGASSPSDYGDYFAWGEAKTKSAYTEKNSTTHKKKNYVFNDAARTNWGSSWRMPTKAECQELVDNCTWEWTMRGGHKGYLATSKKNGNSIFLPAAGRSDGSSFEYVGNFGHFWSSSPNKYRSDGSYCLFFRFDRPDYYFIMISQIDRFYGLSIRPVSEYL